MVVDKVMAIDSSSAQPNAALVVDTQVVLTYTWRAGLTARDADWLWGLSQALTAHAIRWEEVTKFVCGLGPGSFSGIRGALASLQGLAVVAQQPIVGIASAAALALHAARNNALITVVGDARRKRLWVVSYRMEPHTGTLMLANGRVPSHTAEDFALVPADELQSAVPPSSLIISPDWQRLKPLLTECFAAERLVAQTVHPQAVHLARVAMMPSRPAPIPLPIYLHPAVATAPNT